GYVTTFAYDQFERTFTQTVDPGDSTHLNLVTSIVRNAFGQTVTLTDPRGNQTTYAYDHDGNMTLTTVDLSSEHLALATNYGYDNAGRLTSTTVDPTGLAITTSFAYDKNGNVDRKNDANGNKTRYVYDAENRLVWSVDALGDAVNTSYDLEGRVVTVRGYVNVVPSATMAAWPDPTVPAAQGARPVATSPHDRSEHSPD